MSPLWSAEYLLVTLAVVLLAAGVLAWKSSEGTGLRERLGIVGLRLVGLGVLALIAFNPGSWETQRETQGQPWVALLDASPSMSVRDVEGQSRYEVARQQAENWRTAQKEEGQEVRRYVFAGETQRWEEPFPEEVIEAEGTDITGALETVLESFDEESSPQGVVLFSDGREVPERESREILLRARARGIPVHTVTYGGEVDPVDLELWLPRRRLTSFVDQDITLRAVVRNTGLGGIRTEVHLRGADGEIEATERVAVADGEEAEVSFKLQDLAAGYHEFEVSVPVQEGERNARNNVGRVGVMVLEGNLHILAVEGSPHWDSKFIAQLLREQPFVELTTIHRVTRDRFFRVDARQSLEEPAATRAAFPETLEELAAYDLLLLGKGVDYFMSEEQAELVRRFVQEKGGAVVMSRGKAWESPLPPLERIETARWGELRRESLRWLPTVAGAQAGLFGAGLPDREDGLWDRLASISGVREVERLAPFTQVLVEGRRETHGRSTPVLLSRRYGQGLVLTVNSEGLWQWGFFPHFPEATAFYEDLWIQLLQWAATYADFLPGQEYALRLSESTVPVGQAVRVMILDRAEGEGRGAPRLTLRREEETVREWRPARVEEGDFHWQTLVRPEEPGFYRVEIQGPEGEQVPLAVNLEVLAPPQEMDNLSADPDFMRRIAESTGGQFWLAGEWTPEAVGGERAVTEIEGSREWVSRWDQPWWFLLIIGCFAGEWFLRRRKGLT